MMENNELTQFTHQSYLRIYETAAYSRNLTLNLSPKVTEEFKVAYLLFLGASFHMHPEYIGILIVRYRKCDDVPDTVASLISLK